MNVFRLVSGAPFLSGRENARIESREAVPIHDARCGT